MVEYAAREIGPRLPGSNNEKKYHDYMSDKLKELGLNPVTESFVFAPHASIGGLPYAGWAGIIGCVLTVLATILASLSAYAGLAMHFVCTMYMICTWIWLVVSVFKYHTCFDWCFKHKVSHNTYAELLPEDGKYDYTIFLSGHTDTSWTLKLSASQNKLGFVGVVLRLALGAIAVAAVTIVSVVMLILIMMLNYGTDTLSYDTLVNTAKAYYVIKQMTLYSSPIVIICAFLLTMYNEKTEAIASPGAMDNATGVSIAYQVVKYYKENPDKMPKTAASSIATSARKNRDCAVLSHSLASTKTTECLTMPITSTSTRLPTKIILKSSTAIAGSARTSTKIWSVCSRKP